MRQTIKLLSGFFGWLFGWNVVHVSLTLLLITFTALLLAVDVALGKKPRF